MNDRALKQETSVRFAHEEDIDRVMEIDGLSFDRPWQLYQFRSSLKDIFLVYEEDGDILGYMVTVCCYRNIRADILKIAVHPGHRNKGICKKLLNFNLELLKERKIQFVELEVEMKKKAVVNLYERLGFEIVRGYCIDPMDEDSFYVMKMDIR